ncbi:MAG: hypothetical protein WKF97_20440 [Chitinophagaceae bacterium]
MKLINRRKFIQQAGVLAGSPLVPDRIKAGGKVMTVNGPIPSSDLGLALSHEHIMVDFIGSGAVSRSRYEAEEVFNAALPKLISARRAGCKSLFECTPAYLGRDVDLLKRLSAASNLHLITNTGYYGAAAEKYFPAHVYKETAKELAQRWIHEWSTGIDGTGVKPGFIKTGVDTFPLTAAQQKVIEAAAITHLATGLTIGIHTGNGAAAMEELQIIKRQGVSANAWIWIHAQNEKDREFHIRAAREGAWVEYDNVNAKSKQQHIDFVVDMKNARLLDHVLISQDSGWYHVGEKNGGNYNGYDFIFSEFIPALRDAGLTGEEINRIFIHNPANAFSVRIRKV